MSKARKEGAVAAPKGNALVGKPTKTVSEGVKHARNLDAARDFFEAQLPDDAAECKNWPFASTVDRVIAQLNNL